MVLLGKIGESLDEGGSIVGDDFDKGTLPIEDVLKDPVSEGGTRLIAEFQIIQYQALTLDKVLEATGSWHVHCVHIHFCKERYLQGDN